MQQLVMQNTSDETYPKPSRDEAIKAVKTLIAWAGDNPNREGVIDTPKRVLNAYEEFFEGTTSQLMSIYHELLRR